MLATHKAYVYDEKTIMFYMGVRDVNYMDRKYYKLYVEFTDEPLNEGSELKKKLRLWTDNGERMAITLKFSCWAKETTNLRKLLIIRLSKRMIL